STPRIRTSSSPSHGSATASSTPRRRRESPGPCALVKLIYAERSHAGARANNEDFVQYWQSESEQDKDARGAIALLGDGLGGHRDGEIASQLAVTTALDFFRAADVALSTNQLLWRLFNQANLAVYDASMHGGSASRMATTLTVAVFRHNEVAVGHVGDS